MNVIYYYLNVFLTVKYKVFFWRTEHNKPVDIHFFRCLFFELEVFIVVELFIARIILSMKLSKHLLAFMLCIFVQVSFIKITYYILSFFIIIIKCVTIC
jgi:hypothetical protein